MDGITPYFLICANIINSLSQENISYIIFHIKEMKYNKKNLI